MKEARLGRSGTRTDPSGVKKSGGVFHKAILADLLTPVSAFLRVSDGADRAFLLESVEGGEKIGRYSFIGVEPYRSFEGSFAEFRAGFPESEPAIEGLPPFTGGAVGVFCYEMVHEFERISAASSPVPSLDSHAPRPESVLMDFYAGALAFDHLKHQIVILSHESADHVLDLERRLRRRHGQNEAGELLFDGDMASGPTPDELSNFTQEDYCKAVEKAKEYILAGDIFQVVLSQRYEADYPGNPFDVYRALRFLNPSPYLFFLKRGETAIAGSSPEMLLRVEGTNLQYRPIAGTRRRGRDAEEERRLEAELLADEKERAEHLMLVDLGRNDLGRVSRYGSVRVEDLMFLERYSHVVHLVSSLRGTLRDELDRFDAFAACFPAGTVTGAPKVRAMQIIQEIEPLPRRVYAGSIGYLDYSGNLDSCIAIRTVVIENGKARLQAGAGIVADSVPRLEYQECHNKARVLLKALEMAGRSDE